MPRRTLRKKRGYGSRKLRGGQPIYGPNELLPIVVEKFAYGGLPGPFVARKFAHAVIVLKNKFGRLESRDARFKKFVRDFTPDLAESVFRYMKRDPGIASNFLPPDGNRGEYDLKDVCATVLEDFLETFFDNPTVIHKNNNKRNDKFLDILNRYGDTYMEQHRSRQNSRVRDLIGAE